MSLESRLRSRIGNSEFNHMAMAVRRFIEEPGRHLTRKKLAKEILRDGEGPLGIAKGSGYRVFAPGEFPGTETLVRVCQEIVAAKLEGNSIDEIKARGGKSFYLNILNEEDLLGHPEIIEFALSDHMIRPLTAYYGTLPEICFAAIFLSSPDDDESIRGTKTFHWDAGDRRHVKFFMNIEDVRPDNGPLTCLPIPQSDALRNKGMNRWRGIKMTDEKVLAENGEHDLVRLVGPAGTCALVDTSRCLHYGSRCGSGYRLTLVLHYAMFSDYAMSKNIPNRDFNLTTSPALWNRFVREGRGIDKAVYRLKQTEGQL